MSYNAGMLALRQADLAAEKKCDEIKCWWRVGCCFALGLCGLCLAECIPVDPGYNDMDWEEVRKVDSARIQREAAAHKGIATASPAAV